MPSGILTPGCSGVSLHLRRLLPLGRSRWKGGVNNQVRHHQPCWNILSAEEKICCYVNAQSGLQPSVGGKGARVLRACHFESRRVVLLFVFIVLPVRVAH